MSKTTSTAPVVPVTETLNSLKDRQVNWNANAYKSSNTLLYGILQECYQLESKLSHQDHWNQLSNYCQSNNVDCSKKAKSIVKIIKCVFPDIDRRRSSCYSIALRAAKQQKIAADKIAEWIEGEGGVQAVSMHAGGKHKSHAERAEVAADYLLKGVALANIKSATLDAHYDTALEDDNVTKAVVLIAVRKTDGSFDIQELVQSKGVLKAALSSSFTKVAPMVATATVIATYDVRQEDQANLINNSVSSLAEAA